MSNQRYMIGCGWFHSSKTPESERKKQAKRWIENIRRFASPKPECICVVGQGGCRFPESGVESVTVSGDLGNHNDLIKGVKKNEFNGWSGAVLALAMLAYNNESDLIFQEQDCLAFGDYVGENSVSDILRCVKGRGPNTLRGSQAQCRLQECAASAL